MLSQYNIKILNKVVKLLTEYLGGKISYEEMVRRIEIQNNNLEDYPVRKDIYNIIRATYENHGIMSLEEQKNVLTQLNHKLTRLINK